MIIKHKKDVTLAFFEYCVGNSKQFLTKSCLSELLWCENVICVCLAKNEYFNVIKCK